MSAIALLTWCKDGRTDEGYVIHASETRMTLQQAAYYDESDWEEFSYESNENGYWYEVGKPEDPIEVRLVQLGTDRWLVKWDQGNHENCHCHRRVEEVTSGDYYDFSGALREYKALKVREAFGNHDVHNIQIMRYQEVDLSPLEPEVNEAIKIRRDTKAAEIKKNAEVARIYKEKKEKEELARLRKKYPNAVWKDDNDGK